MDYTTIVGAIMMIAIIYLTLTKKAPIAVVYAVMPLATAMIFLGYSFTETAALVEGNVFSAMTGSALLLVFSMTFFAIISETGFFTFIVQKLVRITKGNVYLVMLCTVLVTIISDLDGSLATTYIITIPTLSPLYDRTHLDRRYLLLITGLTTAVMTNYPWDIGIATMATISGVDALYMSILALPLSGIALLVVIGIIFYLGRQHKKAHPIQEIEEITEAETQDIGRPKFFWINMILFLGLLVSLIVLRSNIYLIFTFFTCAAFLINYRDNQNYLKIIEEMSVIFMPPVVIMISISILVGMLQNTGILANFVDILLSLVPTSLARYIHILFALLIVPLFRFLPYQIAQALYPFIMSIGVASGIEAPYTLLPFTVPLIFGCCCSPMVAQTYLGSQLAKVDTDEYIKMAFPICCIGNVVLILTSYALGVLR